MTHELSLMADLLRRVEQVAADAKAQRVTRISVWLGALSHTSPEHFREHWGHAALGTVADRAEVEIELGRDAADPRAQDILLRSVEVQD